MYRLPRRLLTSLLPPLALAVPTACGAAEQGPRPSSEREVVVPLRELSGLAVRTTPAGQELLAVGDEAYALMVMPIENGEPNTTKARTIELPMPRQAGGSELEGVAVDASGNVWVLAERGEIFVYRLDGDSAVEVSHKPIVFAPDHPLATAWAGDPNARAEGIALVGKRVFILKQSGPAALIELIETPEAYIAGIARELSDMADASDLAVAGNELMIIGADAAKICAVPVPGEKGPGGPLPCTKTWSTPDKLGKGKSQWEGLAFLADGRVVVGVDRKKTDRPNVAVLPPLTR